MGLNSKGEGLWLTHFEATCMGHALCYREDQPELAVWCLINGVDTLIV